MHKPHKNIGKLQFINSKTLSTGKLNICNDKNKITYLAKTKDKCWICTNGTSGCWGAFLNNQRLVYVNELLHRRLKHAYTAEHIV